MRKLAIFVEGHTEMILMEKILPELFGYGKVQLVLEQQHGGTTRVLRGRGPADAQYLVQITNCDSDGKVKPFILERRELLKNQGFECIIGLQDVYPHYAYEELEFAISGLQKGVPTDSPLIRLCMAVMEIEAWFLNEETHYPKIDASLTVDRIKRETAFDPLNDCAETKIRNPAKMLAKIYALAGQPYDKHAAEVHRTVAALDPDQLLIRVRAMSPSLDSFIKHVEDFMSGAQGQIAQAVPN